MFRCSMEPDGSMRTGGRTRSPWFALVIMLAAWGCSGEPAEVPVAAEPTPAPEEEAMQQDIRATNAFYYYADVDAAWAFYTDVLGLETVADFGFAKILQVAPSSYLTLVDEARGMHSSEEPKTATLALVTDEVEGWYDYLVEQEVPMRAEFRPAENRPHVGFVAIDPEGYLLEFERFEEHEENVDLLPALAELEPLYPAADAVTGRPADLGVRATVQWLYYRDTAAANDFYAELLGSGPIVDQGWAWAFLASPSGFIGVVDEERGLHNATEDKAVTVSFFVDDIEAWFEFVGTVAGFEFRDQEIGDESGRVATFVGFDPEGYFLEWDTFLDVEGNEELLRRMGHQ